MRLAAARAGFEKDLDFRGQLFAAIDDSILALHRFCEQSAHGMELMGINQEIARDIEIEWKVQMIEIIANGVDEAIASGNADGAALASKGLTSTAVARIIMHAMEGMRDTYFSGVDVEPFVHELIDFVAPARTMPFECLERHV
ncbi:MAG: hypothetical protein U5K75_07695 [Ahrensia sp.]|nr:hypothetical protein [Ahrensia sp.]